MSHEPPFGAARCHSGTARHATPAQVARDRGIGRFAANCLPSCSVFEASLTLRSPMNWSAWPLVAGRRMRSKRWRWLLRRTVGVDRRRSNSLLLPADPAVAVRTVDLALATAEELDFPLLIQVAPAEGHLCRVGGPRGARNGPQRCLADAGGPDADAQPCCKPTSPMQLGEGSPDPGPVASPPAVAVQLGDLPACSGLLRTARVLHRALLPLPLRLTGRSACPLAQYRSALDVLLAIGTPARAGASPRLHWSRTRRGPPYGGPLAVVHVPGAFASQLGADAAEELPHAGAHAATLRARGHWRRAGVRS
jgi:hypothetical protein